MINWNKLHDKAFVRAQAYIEAAKNEHDTYARGIFVREADRLINIIKYIHNRRFGIKQPSC